ncbi:GTP cyclohydrolase II [Denitrobaculum tricleocarpae]|uniref:GTP cyclohydrolase-2 n=1 Tax=Denitrobaculum tricleocarpae TaxID=2591009 RepID=A0A545TRG5_9PROT|nr:GTP cyclohydrolase II [Denitrobaculum tricleocarpae]TQV79812.1 GTP cyclohydrolase II [Denitrobaculum tricleocarpae]
MSELVAENVPIAASALQSVDRAIADLRRGACVLVYTGDGFAALVQSAETLCDATLSQLRSLTAESSGSIDTTPRLLLTARRAAAVGFDEARSLIPVSGVFALSLDSDAIEASTIQSLADPTDEPGYDVEVLRPRVTPAPAALSESAIDLTKLARLLPAAIIAQVAIGAGAAANSQTLPVKVIRDWAGRHDLLSVSTEDIADYRLGAAKALTKVAAAKIPLDHAENTRVVAFRPNDGGIEHLALIIGEPDPSAPVLARMHSECFTGDLLGSLRCDCGDQLRGAIRTMGEVGSGILLYLSQEGRGIGLINKLRAYELQDRGADTAEANEQLGFDADERIYLPAAEMLRQLGFKRVRLLTNNPQKVSALARCGISVEERVAHHFPSNGHNQFYLETKAARFGHYL